MIFERPPWHPGKNLAGTELEWLPTDTKENFDKLMQDSKHRQYFHDKGWDQPGAITSKYYKDTDVFLTNWFMNEENQRLQAKRNRLAITQLAQEHNVWCCIVDSNDYMTQSREEIEYARDYMHGGPQAHKIIAEKILNDWHERHT